MGHNWLGNLTLRVTSPYDFGGFYCTSIPNGRTPLSLPSMLTAKIEAIVLIKQRERERERERETLREMMDAELGRINRSADSSFGRAA